MNDDNEFTPEERDELYRLALKIGCGELTSREEKDRWADLFPRFEKLQKGLKK